MFDPQSSSGSTRNLLSALLVWGGLLLLLAGGALVNPGLIPYLTPPAPPAATVPPADPVGPTPKPSVTPTVLPTSAALPPPLLPSFEETTQEEIAVDPPSPPATPSAATEGYPPTRIVIPAIGLDAPVVTTTWEIVDVGGEQQAVWQVPPMRAAGWHEGSAPLGVPGNTVLNGHNTTHGEVFRDLHLLQPGDRIVLYSGSLPFVYQVDEVLILPEAGQPLEVRLANAQYIEPTQDERVTLVTCHPYGSLRYRLIVIARPTGIPLEENFEGR